MTIIQLLILGLLVWVGIRILSNTLVGSNKADDIIGSTVKVNMRDRDKIFNRFNNADSPEMIDMICHEIQADNERCKINRRANENEISSMLLHSVYVKEMEAEKAEREYMKQKKDEHIKAFGGYFDGNKFVSVREEVK